MKICRPDKILNSHSAIIIPKPYLNIPKMFYEAVKWYCTSCVQLNPRNREIIHEMED